MVKMLKPAGQKIDAIDKMVKTNNRGKMVKLENGKLVNGKTGRGAISVVKMLKPTGSEIDAIGKMAKPLGALQR